MMWRRRKEWWESRRHARASDEVPDKAARIALLANTGLMLLVWLCGVLLLDWSSPQKFSALAVGQRAPSTISARVAFDCLDLQATKDARMDARRLAPPVYRVELSRAQRAARPIETLAERAIAARRDWQLARDNTAVPPSPDAIAAREATVASRLRDDTRYFQDLRLSGEALAAIFPAGNERSALDALLNSIDATAAEGIALPSSAMPPRVILLSAKGTGTDLPPPVASEQIARSETALDRMASRARAALALIGVLVPEADVRALLAATEVSAPNLELDATLTAARRDTAAAGVPDVFKNFRVGAPLVEEYDIVTEQTLVQIAAYHKRLSELETHRDRRLRRMGDSAMILLVLVVCVSWLKSTRPGAFASWRAKSLLVVFALTAEGLASFYNYISVSLNLIPAWVVPFAIPVAFMPMLAALTLEPAAALAVGLWSSLSTAMVFNRDFGVLLLGLGASVLSVALLQGVRKRSQVMRAGLAVGILEVLLAMAMAAVVHHRLATTLIQIGSGLFSSSAAGVLALLCLPAVEWLFKTTSDISLLEYADLSHPLLQRLALEAPGTYHHSLMVASIGRAAADAIGANSLLVSICAFFHDIGKLSKPEFFTENQRGGYNPHDDLAPAMSTIVLQSHVKEGLLLARRHRLPLEIQQAIVAHHGTTLTSYFYQIAKKALQEQGLPEDPGLEHSFRYEGPRPQSREMAVLMLADSVEAASRSLEKPTPQKLAEMVRRIVRDKMLDGQLDDCPITLADLDKLRASFVFSLTNILHGRSPYPRENDNIQPPAQPAPPAPQSPGTRPPAPGDGIS